MSRTDCRTIIGMLKRRASARNAAGMARFGINTRNALGVNVPVLRMIARSCRNDHDLALQLWKTDIHEARLLAGFIDDPAKVSVKQMELWVSDFDSWDICDLVCGNLFDRTDFAYRKAKEWPERKEEYVKRAGFVLMAALSVHDKKAHDRVFLDFFPIIAMGAVDERNFVRKAVNWALRQIGKRNLRLNRAAVRVAKDIARIDSKSARWIASDALRELTDKKVLARLSKKRGEL
ncbi:MAG: DNA alkylation repair protein [Candidatus Omnitrophota bacterium]